MAGVEGKGSSEAGSSRANPNLRQQQILDAYFECPNAAAVARTLKVSDRNVRRVVQQFDHLLVERRQRDSEERVQRIDARFARIEDWADSKLGETLERLDELAASQDHGVALRAIKMKLDIARQAPSPAPISRTSEANRIFDRLDRELADRIAELEDDLDQEGEGA